MLASSLMACTVVRIQILATTACPALLATQERSPLAEAWSRLLLTNRQVNVLKGREMHVDGETMMKD